MVKLAALLEKSVAAGMFGAKMRSVIKAANPTGIAAIVAQQFEVAAQITAAGLMPIIGGISTAFNLIRGFSSKTLLGSGLRGVLGPESSIRGYKTYERSSFWGLFKSRSTDTFDVGANDMLREAVTLQRRGVFDQLRALGLQTAPGYSQTFKIDTRGMSSEEAEDAVIAELENYGENLAAQNATLRDARQLGETHIDALRRLNTSLDTFNDVARVLGMDVLPKTMAGAEIAADALAAAGGADVFAAGFRAYIGGILDPEEQRDVARRAFEQQAADLGLNVRGVDTRDEFQDQLERFGARGDDTRYAQFLATAGAFSEWMSLEDAVNQNTDQLERLNSELTAENFATYAGFETARDRAAAGLDWQYDYTLPPGATGAGAIELLQQILDQSKARSSTERIMVEQMMRQADTQESQLSLQEAGYL
jgi:hypothetical protein